MTVRDYIDILIPTAAALASAVLCVAAFRRERAERAERRDK